MPWSHCGLLGIPQLRCATGMTRRSFRPAICLRRPATGYGTMGLLVGDSTWWGASAPRSPALVFSTKPFRSRLWIMPWWHLQSRQQAAPPSCCRRRRSGSLRIRRLRPSTLSSNSKSVEMLVVKQSFYLLKSHVVGFLCLFGMHVGYDMGTTWWSGQRWALLMMPLKDIHQDVCVYFVLISIDLLHVFWAGVH